MTQVNRIAIRLFSALVIALILSAATILVTPEGVNAEVTPQFEKQQSIYKAAQQRNKPALSQLGVGENIPSKKTALDKIVKGTLYCIGVLLAGMALRQRFSNKMQASDNPIKILARQVINGKNYILLVECNDRQFLVGSTAESLTTLAALDDRANDQFAESLNFVFEKQLKAAVNNA